jgi:hypothetical protein
MVESWACLIEGKDFGPYSELGVGPSRSYSTESYAIGSHFCETADGEVGIRRLYLGPPRNEPQDIGRYEPEDIKDLAPKEDTS